VIGLMARHRRRRSERGAGLTEMALIIPVIAVLVMGVFEFGMAWRSDITVSNALRSGTRALANTGEGRLADYNALLAVKSAMSNTPNITVTKVVIFRSATTNGSVPTQCLTASAQTAGGVNTTVSGTPVRCNVYSATRYNTFALSNFAGTTSCNSGSWDAVWCPTTREGSQAVGADYVGIYMEVEHDFQTGMFGDGISMDDKTIMRIEPEAQA
jgi:Flp pilus assembly protein TadG